MSVILNLRIGFVFFHYIGNVEIRIVYLFFKIHSMVTAHFHGSNSRIDLFKLNMDMFEKKWQLITRKTKLAPGMLSN